MAGRGRERFEPPMPYTPDEMRAYLHALKQFREDVALGRMPPSIWSLPVPAEHEPLPNPPELRRIDRLIKVVESELDQLELVVYQQLVIERIVSGKKTVATIGNTATATAKTLVDGESPRWSPDGKQIAYMGLPGTKWQIYIIDPPSGTPIDFSHNHSFHEMNPTWSPSGDEIAFESDRGNGWQIYARQTNAPGSTPRAITSGFGHHVDPAWSPKSDFIACSIFSAPPTSSWTDAQIYLVPADGSQSSRVQVTNDPSVVDPFGARWSPDATQIVFHGGSKALYPSRHYVYVVGLRGSGIARQLTTVSPSALPSWSSDGRSIAYWAWPNQQDAGIYVVDPAGTSTPKKWPGTGSADDSPDWQPG
jgi:Tol biopolymer transport system component